VIFFASFSKPDQFSDKNVKLRGERAFFTQFPSIFIIPLGQFTHSTHLSIAAADTDVDNAHLRS
jgi:hypothetical protein